MLAKPQIFFLRHQLLQILGIEPPPVFYIGGSETLPPKTAKMALLVGNEGNGVTDASAALCYAYRLPMPGRAESLNAAVFGAILLYELLR